MVSLFRLEEEYKLSDINEWAYLRSYYRQALGYGGNKTRIIGKIQSIKNMFYGFFSWFKRYKYFIFSDTAERRFVKGKLFDKSTDFIIDVLNKEDTLLIEEPGPIKHFKKDEVYTKNIVSRRLLDAITLVLEGFFFKKYDYPILNKITQEYKLNIDYSKQINRFNARYMLYKFIFKLYKVELVIVNCYYSKQYILKAAHDLNIKTIEVQHGVINTANDAYLSNIKMNKAYFPEYLLSFGENEEKILKKGSLVSKKVISVGSFYLEYLLKSFTSNTSLMNIKREYNVTIGVSLQKGSEDMVLDFINEVSKMDNTVLYIIIPRVYNVQLYAEYSFVKNIIFFKDLDCYQTVMHCDYHCTFYSACAVEAPSLGVPNILLNFNGDAKKYYNSTDGKTSKIVNNSEEFLKVIDSKDLLSKDMKKNNSIFIKDNYTSNIKQLKRDGFFENIKYIYI